LPLNAQLACKYEHVILCAANVEREHLTAGYFLIMVQMVEGGGEGINKISEFKQIINFKLLSL
jgi:hypothetical protein